MNIPKPIRKFFSPDYRFYQSQLRKFDQSVPQGAPPLTKSGGKPVGPNFYESLSPEQRKGLSPDYPVEYQVPVEARKRAPFRSAQAFFPSGESAGFSTGPGLLAPEHRIPGRFDYSQIPNLTVTPIRTEESALSSQTSRVARTGLPANPETGFPTLPPLQSGAFKHKMDYPPAPREIPLPPARPRSSSLDSMGLPIIPD